jgi:hypothetical protein
MHCSLSAINKIKVVALYALIHSSLYFPIKIPYYCLPFSKNLVLVHSSVLKYQVVCPITEILPGTPKFGILAI